MKLKLNQTCSCGPAGEVVDVDLSEGRSFVIAGLATELPDDPKPPKKAKAMKAGPPK